MVCECVIFHNEKENFLEREGGEEEDGPWTRQQGALGLKVL